MTALVVIGILAIGFLLGRGYEKTVGGFFEAESDTFRAGWDEGYVEGAKMGARLAR